jgi:NDP-sugar pyrophosphorylase family protein
MKALILAAGRGSRLGEQTEDHNKCMLLMLGKPLIQYSLENAARAGVSEIIVVVGYRAEQIINRFGIEFEGVRVQYVLQDDASSTCSRTNPVAWFTPSSAPVRRSLARTSCSSSPTRSCGRRDTRKW